MTHLRTQTQVWLADISADLRRAIQQEVDGLRSSVEQRIAVLENLVSTSDDQLTQFVLNVEGVAAEIAQESAAQARQEAETAAQAELTSFRASFQTELETTRAEFQARRTALETQLAETERDISVIRQKRDEHAATLEHARGRMASLEEDNAQAKLQQEFAEALLEEEVQRRIALEKQLETSHQELVLAKAEADSRRLEAQVAGERIRTLEKTASSASEFLVVLAAVNNGLEDLSRASSDALLSTLVKQLKSDFSTVAIFAVTSQGFRLWKADDSGAALSGRVPSLEDNSLLTQALRQCAPVRIDATSPDGVGLWQRPLGHAIALPILAQGRVIALVYAENPPGHSGQHAKVLDTVAEILVGCVNRRLNRSKPAPELDASRTPELPPSATAEGDVVATLAGAADSRDFAVSRQAGRVKINTAVEVIIDGATSRLVDVSTSGAQLLSPTALRPNRRVQIALQNGDGAFTCGGRVVWALLELSGTDAHYRAGIQFTNIDAIAIDAFVSRHCQAAPVRMQS
jgi:PilZ domain-containing protein/GAF domain-containing protein